MSHKDVLLQLFPLDLGGMHESDCAAAGSALDRVEAAIDALLLEMHPGTATLMLDRWEALYEITPAAGATVEQRQAVVSAKHALKGDIKKPYFVALAVSMGYTIRIDDYTESMAGWQCAGDEFLEDQWDYFTAGVGAAGDTLAFEHVVLPWIWEVVVTAVPASPPTPDLEAVLQDLKPAHIQLNFTYL